MCLAIPGQIIEVVDDDKRLALVDVAGVQRKSTSACSTPKATASAPATGS